MHKNELFLKCFQEPKNPTRCTSIIMNKLSVDNYSDDDLMKRYMDLVDKNKYDETCKNCRMSTLLHDGPCTRMQAVSTFENDSKILEERDKFAERMRKIRVDVENQEQKEKADDSMQKMIEGFLKAMQANEGKTTRIVKPAKVPVWTQKMELRTYWKALEVWMEQNRGLSENQRVYEVVESLKLNKEVNGLADYVAVMILPRLDTVEKQTVKNLYEMLNDKYGKTRIEELEGLVSEWMEFRPNDYDRADDYWTAIEKLDTKIEEKGLKMKEFFSIWAMIETKKRKGMDKFELTEMRNVVKKGGDNVMKNLKDKFRELKIESNRGEVIECNYMGKESPSRARYHEQRRRRESQNRDFRTRRDSQGRDYFQDRRGMEDSRGRTYFRRYYRGESRNPRDFSRDFRSFSRNRSSGRENRSRSSSREENGRDGDRRGFRGDYRSKSRNRDVKCTACECVNCVKKDRKVDEMMNIRNRRKEEREQEKDDV